MSSAVQRLLLYAASGTLAVLASAGLAASQATAMDCGSSTPQGVSVLDSPYDGQDGLAPEITEIVVAIDGACNLGIGTGLTRPLVQGDAVFHYIDTDGNAATGSPVFDGSDAVVGTLGSNGPNEAPVLTFWNGSTFDFAAGVPLTPVDENGSVVTTLGQLGIANPTVITERTGTIYSGLYGSYADFAPDPGFAPLALPVTFAPLAAAPPTAPIAAPTVPTAALPGACTTARTRVRALTRQISRAKQARSRATTSGARRAAQTRIARLTRARRAALATVRGSCPAERQETERSGYGRLAQLAKAVEGQRRRVG